MLETFFVSFGTACWYALWGIVLVYVMLRLWNRLTGNRFDAAYEKIMADPRAAAIYCGLRILAFCILVGFLLS